MFKFKFDKKTKEQKDMEKQGKKLEKEYFKDLDLIKNEIDEKNFPSKSDKDALIRVKKDFPNVSYGSRGYITRK